MLSQTPNWDRKLPLQFRNGFAGIYIHFPYCYLKCDYCDFYSEGIGPGPAPLERALLSAYKSEFMQRGSLEDTVVDSIFIGGGTPSKAKAETWKELIHFFRNETNLSPLAEISLEMNPEDASLSYLEELTLAGFNRVNIGVQATDPQALQFLGRHYDREKYEQLPQILDRSPLPNMGIDLMYGIPNVPRDFFWEDLQRFLQSRITHISLYSLTLEKGTKYSREAQEGKKKEPEEETQRELFLQIPEKLESHGFEWYEVSNFAKNQAFSRHNLKYWTGEPYLGLGPGAHGFWKSNRYGNPRSTTAYLKKPFGAKLEPADPLPEIALSLFRILLPFEPLTYFKGFLSEPQESALLEIFSVWNTKGICFWDGKVFHWKSSSLLMLDEYILELVMKVQKH